MGGRFEKFTRVAEFRSPLACFAQTFQEIEYRRGPLTGAWCRINTERAKRVKQAKVLRGELPDFARIKEKCYFCPQNLEDSTPMLPDYFPSGRLKVGRACLFPNLFPFGEFHAVVTFSEDHFLPLDSFTPDLIRDCVKVCVDYFRIVFEKHPDVKYFMINWNYMPPAAASIIHPHLQILAESRHFWLRGSSRQAGNTPKVVETSGSIWLRRKGRIRGGSLRQDLWLGWRVLPHRVTER